MITNSISHHVSCLYHIAIDLANEIMQEVIVDEDSGTIDGFEKLGLGVDHLQMNKFWAPHDPIYALVVSRTIKMAQEAQWRVTARLHRMTPATRIRERKRLRSS